MPKLSDNPISQLSIGCRSNTRFDVFFYRRSENAWVGGAIGMIDGVPFRYFGPILENEIHGVVANGSYTRFSDPDRFENPLYRSDMIHIWNDGEIHLAKPVSGFYIYLAAHENDPEFEWHSFKDPLITPVPVSGSVDIGEGDIDEDTGLRRTAFFVTGFKGGMLRIESEEPRSEWVLNSPVAHGGCSAMALTLIDGCS